jgi:spore maturation protein CgeB
VKVLFLGADFMLPYWRPEIKEPVAVNLHEPLEAQITPHRDAAFAYAMNTVGGENVPKLWAARDLCRQLGIRTVWHSMEDPNSFGTFAAQAEGFDVIATTDTEKIPAYLELYPSAKVIWLPLAAQPTMHQPRPTAPDATDLILIANWYTNDARLAAVRTLLDPLLEAGFSLSLYAYAHPAWPEKYRRWWRGATSCYDVVAYYPNGRIALGMNNQAWGTAMCSMRTFEVLACGKPFLSFHSDAYERLGFVNGEHFIWSASRAETEREAAHLILNSGDAQAMADRGREFVLEHHTYSHRLHAIREALGV